MKSSMFPLVRRQFRGLKWFAIAFALLACWFAMNVNSYLNNEVSNFWNNGPMEFYSRSTPLNALGAYQKEMLVMLGILTVAMAVFQMLDAYNPKNALLMGSLPPTRGTQLAAQLGSGVAVIALGALLFGVLTHLSYANHRDMMILQARMSVLPGPALAANTHWIVFLAWFRLMIVLISVYLGVTTVYGLFGNAALSLGALAAIAMLAYTAYGVSRSAMYQIHRVFPALKEFSGSRVLEAAVGMGTSRHWALTPDYRIWRMPWVDLPWFLLTHALLWAVGLLCISRTRKHLAIESLGGAFAFKVSRWAVVLLATPFPLLLRFQAFSVYNSKLERTVINPNLYMNFIPSLLVFALGWVFLIWRPQRKLKRRAAAAVTLALALLLTPGLARAEKNAVPRLEAQFDSSRLSFDKAAFDRNQALADVIFAQDVEALKLRDPDYEDDNYRRYSRPDYPQIAYSEYQAKPSFGTYQQLLYPAGGVTDYTSLGGYRMNQQELERILRDAGLDRLADALRDNTAETLLVAQDGFFLEWTRRVVKDPAKNPGAETAIFSLFPNTAFQVVGSEAVDTAIRQGDKLRRTNAFSNGDLDTQRYEIALGPRYGKSGNRIIPLHAVFQNGSLDRLMLAGYKDTSTMSDAFEALRRALIAAGQSESDANAAIDALLKLYADDRLGSGSSGSIRWSLSKSSWNGDDRNVMIELG